MPPDFPPSYFTSLPRSLSFSPSLSLSTIRIFLQDHLSQRLASGNASKRIKDDCWKVAIALKRRNYKSGIAAEDSRSPLLHHAITYARARESKNREERERERTMTRRITNRECKSLLVLAKRANGSFIQSYRARRISSSEKCITKSKNGMIYSSFLSE